MEVKAECKVCKSTVASDLFRLHHDYKQMVCPSCFTGKTKQKQEAVKKPQVIRPPGWDAEDEYLEKMSKIKMEENKSQFSKVPGTDYVKCLCSSCKYSFRYNPYKKQPTACPYCNSEIPKLKTFNLL